MRTLPPPNDSLADVLALILAATPDPALQAKLQAIIGDLNAAAADYSANATARSLNLVPRVTAVGAFTKAELIALYADHLSKANGAARIVYDRIRNSAPNKRCPLCGVGTVVHCDHHLPKARYGTLTILPLNLVPACHFCNDTKKSKYPQQAGEQTFHPYFDGHLLGAPWVRAQLDHGPPPVLVFDTDPPIAWPQVDRDRVARHFTACGLAVTFTSSANNQLAVIRDQLILQANRGGTNAVQQFLDDECNVYAARPHGWEYPTYRALAADAWFVGGGYLTVT